MIGITKDRLDKNLSKTLEYHKIDIDSIKVGDILDDYKVVIVSNKDIVHITKILNTMINESQHIMKAFNNKHSRKGYTNTVTLRTGEFPEESMEYNIHRKQKHFDDSKYKEYEYTMSLDFLYGPERERFTAYVPGKFRSYKQLLRESLDYIISRMIQHYNIKDESTKNEINYLKGIYRDRI